MIIGYARVSTLDQNLDRQIDQLQAAGCERIYQEKITGTRRERPELDRMIEALREGDTILVCELTRIGRSVKDLFDLVEQFQQIGANIKSLKEPWLDTTTAHDKLLFTIFSGVSQFERDLIQMRTNEGLQAARARGRKGGRPKVNQKNIDLALNLYDSKSCSIADILKTTGISKATLYSYLKRR